MSFLSPERLWLLLAVAALCGLYAALQARRRQYAVRFTNLELLASVAPRHPGWRRHLTAAGFLTALAALVVAFAQPARAVEVPRERATVMLAIDTSLSMEATDIEPNRIEAAKDAAQQFVDEIPDTMHVGLVSFDGAAVVRVPPTLDHDLVRQGIRDLELYEQTAIGEAIRASLQAITAVVDEDPTDEDPPDAPPGAVVLLSDGETTVGTPNDVATAEATEAGVAVSTIAFGTPDGYIDLPEGRVDVPVNESSLAEIAEETGGSFYTAESADELAEVYTNLGTAVGYETEDQEITAWMVGLALVLLAATAAGSLVWFSRLP